MDDLLGRLAARIEGEIKADTKTLSEYSYDTSVFAITPSAVVSPKNSSDLKKIVRFVTENKHLYPDLSITPRGAGTDMSGGAINSSLILDMTMSFSDASLDAKNMLHAQPGAFMRNIDPTLQEKGLFLGSVPASRALVTIGGMIGNNAGGEQSLRYGNVQRWVRSLTAILADGNEYEFKPLKRNELEKKLQLKTFEGEVYRRVFTLVETHYDLIKNARPRTHKNSTGYNLWDVWDRSTGIFDMTQLFSGSQGTLGVISNSVIEPIKEPKHSRLMIAYLSNTKLLEKIIPLVLKQKPATFEGFDDITFKLGIKHFSYFRKKLGTKEWLRQQAALLKEVATLRGITPKIVLLVEFDGNTFDEVNAKIIKLQHTLKAAAPRIKTEIEGTEDMSEAFWNIRRASFTLLRQKIQNKYASPFIDDLTVDPKHLVTFLPELRKVISKHKLPATIAGHFGDGNFHVVPLIDIGQAKARNALESAMRELVPIVKKYRGSLAGEHNDGLIRGPWLRAMYGEDVFALFKETKEIFDPMYIFNPNKKTDASWDFATSHFRKN